MTRSIQIRSTLALLGALVLGGPSAAQTGDEVAQMLRALPDTYRARVVVRSIPLAGMNTWRYGTQEEGEPLTGEFRVSRLEDGVLVVRSVSGGGALAVRYGAHGLEWEELGDGRTPPQRRDLVALVHVFDKSRFAFAAAQAEWARIDAGAGCSMLQSSLDSRLVEDPPKNGNNNSWGQVGAIRVDTLLELNEDDELVGADLDVVLGVGMGYDDFGFGGNIRSVSSRDDYTPTRLQTIQLSFLDEPVSEFDRTLARVVRARTEAAEDLDEILPQKLSAPEGAVLEGDSSELALAALEDFLSVQEERRWLAEVQIALPPRIQRGMEALVEHNLLGSLSIFDTRRLVTGTLDLVQLEEGVVALRGMHGHDTFLAAPGDPPLLSSGRNGQGLQPVASVLLDDLSGLFASELGELVPEGAAVEELQGGPPGGRRISMELGDAPFEGNPLDAWNERAGLRGAELLLDLDATGRLTQLELTVRRQSPLARRSVSTNGETLLDSKPEEGEVTEMRQTISLVPSVGEPPAQLRSFGELARLLREERAEPAE